MRVTMDIDLRGTIKRSNRITAYVDNISLLFFGVLVCLHLEVCGVIQTIHRRSRHLRKRITSFKRTSD
jgi:hypothetical protein